MVKLQRNRLLALRAGKKWTQLEAATAAKISLTTYANAELGRDVHLLTAFNIAEAFGQDMGSLLHKDEPREETTEPRGAA